MAENRPNNAADNTSEDSDIMVTLDLDDGS